MKRIGMFTGKIYEEGTDLSTINECCVTTDNTEEWNITRIKLKCKLCSGGCPNKPIK